MQRELLMVAHSDSSLPHTQHDSSKAQTLLGFPSLWHLPAQGGEDWAPSASSGRPRAGRGSRLPSPPRAESPGKSVP